MLTQIRSLLIVGPMLLAACSTQPTAPKSSTNPIIGGQPEATAPAVGYLTFADTAADLDPSSIACGATLIAPNVVMTAAHCVLAQASSAWAFGTGASASSSLVTVVSTHVHPQYSPSNPLRNYDLAYLILTSAVPGVAPAILPSAKPADGCGYQAVGYDSQGNPVGAEACIQIQPTLGQDPILEVHPAGGAALCASDGDYGSALIQGGGAAPVLVGLYVGSVTQPLTDCVSGAQFLDGYESAFGYATFFAQAVSDGANALALATESPSADPGPPPDDSSGDAGADGSPDPSAWADSDAGF